MEKYFYKCFIIIVLMTLLRAPFECSAASDNANLVAKKEIKENLEKDIFDNLEGSSVSVASYCLSEKEAKNLTNDILEENHTDNLMEVSFETNAEGNVTTMSVETDDAFMMASNELESINEEQEEPLSDSMMQQVISDYAELQTFYEANPDYFGITGPFFSSKDTEETPVGALINMAGMDPANLDLNLLDLFIIHTHRSLKYYASTYGDELLKERDKALSCLDDRMTTVEKLLVLHDYIANQCTFNVDFGEDGSDSLYESTPFAVLVSKSAICLGYSSTYAYLVQCAFPEIYKNEDGTWKSKEEVQSTYMIDYGNRIITSSDMSQHYYNMVKIDEKWYYVDVCFDDYLVQHQQEIRVETDGNCRHDYFLVSNESYAKRTNIDIDLLDNLYKKVAIDQSYENAWFSNVHTPIVYNDNNWFYVESQKKIGNYSGTSLFIDKKDKLKMRDRESGKITVLIDYASDLQEEYKNDLFYNKLYPGMQHSVGIYDEKLYFNLANKIYQYDLISDTIEVLKEYNEVNVAVHDTDSRYNYQFYTKTGDFEGKKFTIWDHPVCSIAIKNDGKMYVSIATNFSLSTKEPYKTEEVYYRYHYNQFGECYKSGEGFQWCANVKETLDMQHLTSDEHVYESVNIRASCREQGYTQLRCKECGKCKGEKYAVTDSIDHHYLYLAEKNIYYCTICHGTADNVTEHNYYGKPEFKWISDSECKAYFVCTTCGEGKKEIDCNEEIDITNSDYISQGIIIRTASCQFNGNEYSETWKEILPTLEIETKLGCDTYSIYATQQVNIDLISNWQNEEIESISSSDPKIVKVSEEGMIQGVKAGQVEVTILTKSGKTLIASVTVKTPKVTLNASSVPLQRKKSTSAVKIKSKLESDSVLKWTTSNKKIATVDKRGKITGKRNGTVKIIVTMKSGAKATCKVKVQSSPISLKKISLNSSRVIMTRKGKKRYFQIQVAKTPVTSTDKIIYKSTKEKIVTVDKKGKITAKRAGTAYIIVRCGKVTKKSESYSEKIECTIIRLRNGNG